MTKEEAYKLIQKQNWYKLFIKVMETRGKIFNDAYRLNCTENWIFYAFTWSRTPQGREYWAEINNKWRALTY